MGKLKNHLLSTSLFLLGSLLLGCGKTETSQPSSAAPAHKAATMVDKSTAGAISGIVSFQGTAPKMPMLDLSSDPACPPDPEPQDVVLVRDGKLANVFVYVKE